MDILDKIDLFIEDVATTTADIAPYPEATSRKKCKKCKKMEDECICDS